MNNKIKSNTNGKIAECKTINVRLTAEEGARFAEMLYKSGLTKTDFIKKAIFSNSISFVDGGTELLAKLAECAEMLCEINAIISRKDIGDIGIRALFDDVKSRQRSLGLRFGDIEQNIAEMMDAVLTTKGGKADDNEKL